MMQQQRLALDPLSGSLSGSGGLVGYGNLPYFVGLRGRWGGSFLGCVVGLRVMSDGKDALFSDIIPIAKYRDSDKHIIIPM